jgi:hypothetical protein
MDFEEFKRRLAEAGLHPSDAALHRMHEALPHLEAMKTRVNRDYDMAAEPAHVFDAGGEP